MKDTQTVQQTMVSGRVRQQPEISFVYTAAGPTLETLLKALLRTAALPGQR